MRWCDTLEASVGLRKVGLGVNAGDCNSGGPSFLASQPPELCVNSKPIPHWLLGGGQGRRWERARHLPIGGSTGLGSGDLRSSFLFNYKMK